MVHEGDSRSLGKKRLISSGTLLTILAASLLTGILSVPQVWAYGKAHSYITMKALEIWPGREDHEVYKHALPADSNFLRTLQNHDPVGSPEQGTSILEGAVEEDHGKYVGKLLWWMDHAWNPDTNSTWNVPVGKVIEHTAVDKGISLFIQAILKYKKGDKPSAYWYLGRAAHCLQDMAVPAHVHCDRHIDKPGWEWVPGVGEDDYENWSEEKFSNWREKKYGYSQLRDLDLESSELVQDSHIPQIPSTLESSENKALKKLFYNLAQASQCFPSDNAVADFLNAPPFAADWPRFSIFDFKTYEDKEKVCSTIGSLLIPRAIQFTAELYRLFWNKTHSEDSSEDSKESYSGRYALRIAGSFEIVKMAVGSNIAWDITRSGKIGDKVTWVIEENGRTVLERNASGEMKYTYFRNAPGYRYRIWLNEFIQGRYQRVSNIVSYTVPETFYQVRLGRGYEVARSGKLDDALTWVVEEDGKIVLERNAGNENRYTYYRHRRGSTYRIWLNAFFAGMYWKVSNVVTYRYP